MAEQKLSQEFVDKVTGPDAPDGPSIIGHIERIQDAYKRLFVERFLEMGFAVEDAEACYNAPYDDMTPQEAADEEMSYFDDDGDGPP